MLKSVESRGLEPRAPAYVAWFPSLFKNDGNEHEKAL